MELAKKPPLDGDTLILPCVAIGSVAQLAIDFLLGPDSPYEKAEHMMTLDASCCMPFVGGCTDSQGIRFITPLEVYRDASNKVSIIQQRSPPLKARKDEFVADLVAWTKRSRFKQVLILTSIDAALRDDNELQTRSSHFAQMSGPKQSVTPLSSRLSDIVPPLASIRNIPGSGLARHLMAAFGSQNVPASLLAVYCAEGDNRHDAKLMAHHVHHALNSSGKLWGVREPEEWSMVFGSGPHRNQKVFD